MEKFRLTTRKDVITTDTTLADEKYGGWLAVNTGDQDVVVDGYTLQPGDGLDFTNIPPNVIWSTPISIQCPTAGGVVTLTRFLYTVAQ